jgi:outer membrane protein assembly factor BamB
MQRFGQPLTLSALFVAISTSQSFAAPALTVTPGVGHPKTATQVSGSGLTASEAVDVYFDTTDEFLAVTNSTGSFAANTLTIPKDALPGRHWITAVGRKTGDAVQHAFTVRTDWLQYAFESHDRGRNPFENVIDASNVGTLDVAWSYTTGNVVEFSSPAYFANLIYVGSCDDKLYAFTTSGALKWSATTGGCVESSPSIAHGNVYVGSDDGKIYAFKYLTGAPLWSAATGGAVQSGTVVVGNIVYAGSNDGRAYALNATTGAALWSTATGGVIGYSTPAVVNGTVYIGSYDDKLYALDASTGAVLWSYLTGGPIYSAPAVANGAVYFGSADESVYALNAKNGALLWSQGTAGAVAPQAR